MDKIKICKSFLTILDKFFSGMKPPDDIVVNARWRESNSLILVKVNKKIIKSVDIKYIVRILKKL